MTEIFEGEVALYAPPMDEFNLESAAPADVFSKLEDIAIHLQSSEAKTLTRLERVALKKKLKAMLPKAWEAVKESSGEDRQVMKSQFKAIKQIIDQL